MEIYQDIFCEQIVKKKKDRSDMLFNITSSLAAITFMIFFILSKSLGWIRMFAPFVAVGVVYLLIYVIKQRNVEYEYSITNAEMDLTEIIDMKKRRKLYTINCRNIQCFGEVTPENRPHYKKPVDKICNVTTGRKDVRMYFFIVRNNNETLKIYFEPTDEMVQKCKKYIPKQNILQG